ncbi:MAG: hypothetical protein J2P46_07645 [Zavarzinella sp.]|nr:hypothetical protein [Zavarzinella sp.]
MLPDFVGRRLKPLATDLPETWRLWEHKTLNIHRGVIHWDATATDDTLADVREEVRAVVARYFRPAWWRGFGFGTVVSLGHADESFGRAAELIDVRNNRRGTWQWLALHFPKLREAVGVCTWTEGYLAPVYRDLLEALRGAGFRCQSYQRDMDALVKHLVTVAEKLRAAKRVLGGLGGLAE